MNDKYDRKFSIPKKLNKVLKKAVISDNLRKAVEGIIAAVAADDLKTACGLSACKGLIVDSMEQPPERDYYTFREDGDFNEKAMKTSVYSILHDINFDLSIVTDTMPSGMMLLSVNKITGRPSISESKPEGKHPLIKQIKFEKEECHRRFEKEKENRRKKAFL